MKKLLVFFILSVMPLSFFAQNATKILDTATANFKKLKCLKSTYTIGITEKNQTSSYNGAIIMQGNKYVNYINGTTIWFNGKTMWTLVEENEEVTITEPNASELMSSNPYYFLNSYKKDFNSSLINASGNNYVVQLTPKKQDNDLSKIIITLTKSNYKPTRLQVNTKKNVVDIMIKSYINHHTYKNSSFTFNPKLYSNVEVVDLR